ncbi:MAG: KpsF/GutQ family sugar-phosphate isomerase [Lachnospiraceae bacterium]|nr:KpsF/GutQ family sugar-phosphate isomerase [Lachnospiraceae bacterium]
MQIDTLEIIKNVLEIEAKGILQLKNSIGQELEELINMCSQCTGKIILTGMGKSGHVARKISATMASLGTPSFFLHPAEAAHGDLGMIEKTDILIMLSKSGDTDELIQLVNSLKRIGCSLVGIFCHKDSILEKYCDLTIVTPIEKEACINNLAPTTSTTVAMALGDAIAVTLSKLKGFKDSDFALFHPNGSLGKRLLTTADTLLQLSKEEVSVKENDNVEKVLWTITNNHLGATAVINDVGNLIGLVTDGDIRRGLKKEKNILQSLASNIMTCKPICVNHTMLAVDIFNLMQQKKISVVPVIDENNLFVGMISMHDIVASGAVG